MPRKVQVQQAEKQRKAQEAKAKADRLLAVTRQKKALEDAEQAKAAAEQKARNDQIQAQSAIDTADTCVYNYGSDRFMSYETQTWRSLMTDALYEYVQKLNILDYLKQWQHPAANDEKNFNAYVMIMEYSPKEIVALEWGSIRREKDAPKYRYTPGKSTQLNRFLANIPDWSYCATVTPLNKGGGVHAFYIDKEEKNNVFSYCIKMDFVYSKTPDYNPVTLHTFDASLHFETLHQKPPTPSDEAVQTVRTQLRRGLVNAQLELNFKRDGTQYTFNAFLSPSLFNFYSKTKATATVDFSSQTCFCSVALAGTKETSTFKTYDEFVAWAATHTERMQLVSRMAQNVSVQLDSIERLL